MSPITDSAPIPDARNVGRVQRRREQTRQALLQAAMELPNPEHIITSIA